MRASKELVGIVEWLQRVALVVEDFEGVLGWKRDWRFVAKLRDQLKSLQTLKGILGGVSCTGAMKEALEDLLAEIVKGIEREYDSSLMTSLKGGE